MRNRQQTANRTDNADRAYRGRKRLLVLELRDQIEADVRVLFADVEQVGILPAGNATILPHPM